MQSIYKPGKPPKNYNNSKSIGLFVLRGRNCIEIVRGRINPKGDVYLFEPNAKSLPQSHESFHVSGDFHLRWGNEKHIPLLKEDDKPKAFRNSLYELGITPCLCFRRGKGLNTTEVEKIIDNLVRYAPKNIRKKDIVSELLKKNFAKFKMSFFSCLIQYIKVRLRFRKLFKEGKLKL